MKNYHIAFSYWSPMPGMISIPANSPEEATKLLMDMAKDMKEVVIHQVVDDFEQANLMALVHPMDAAVDDELLEYELLTEKKPN